MAELADQNETVSVQLFHDFTSYSVNCCSSGAVVGTELLQRDKSGICVQYLCLFRLIKKSAY